MKVGSCMNLSFDEMYDAIGRKESFYEGTFITAVKTTGIFCRPSCRARKPLAKNVEFFASAEEALKHGYRPCKVCRPMNLEDQTPSKIKALLDELQARPHLKLQDQDLRQRGVEPSYIRRWFKRRHNMTFHTYQRLIRLNSGYRKIKAGMPVTHTAFDSGYESASGFGAQFKSVFGDSPAHSEGKAVIYLHRFSTKIGPMFAAATEKGLCLLEFTDRRMLENEFKDLRKRLNAVFVPE